MSALDEIEDIQFCDNNAKEATEAKREVLRIVASLRSALQKAEEERDFYRRQFPTAAKNWQAAVKGDA